MTSPEILKEVFIFQENENCDLRSGTHLTNRNKRTAHFVTDVMETCARQNENPFTLSVFKS